MMFAAGDLLTLRIEKPVAGGRMLARHGGRVVLVLGAVPGEDVLGRVTRVAKGVAYADTAKVLSASSDRRDPACDPLCGGSVLAHITPTRQRTLKAEIVADAMGRLGGYALEPPDVVPSVEAGYRMRARFHVRDGRLGFYREGSHDLCDAAATGQFLPAACDWIGAMETALASPAGRGVLAVEMAEDVPGRMRVCHLDMAAGADAKACAGVAVATGLEGLSASRADQSTGATLAGSPEVTDELSFSARGGTRTLRLTRNVRAFFQGNRFLLSRLVEHVVDLVPPGPVVDLYAGVGLFGLALAAAGEADVTLVEGEPVSSADLAANAAPFGEAALVVRRKVEMFLTAAVQTPGVTVVVDPPRTGLTKEATDGLRALAPATLIYVSCDVATLARDTRRLLAAGYALVGLTVFDLFPNTAHVETVARFRRQ